MHDFTYAQIAKMIDHSLLQQPLTDDELDRGCKLAREYDVASVCIKPYYVRQAAELLAGSTVAVGTTVGFPHGGHVTAVKAAEAKQALADGATELDMVVNIGKVLSRDWRYVSDDIRAVVETAHAGKALVKVIFENCLLQDEHKEQLCRICGEVGADFVKTSTGYGSTGATDDDLRLMRRCAPPHVQVKAAGGVRDFERLLAVRAIGVTRVGATATRAILDRCRALLACAILFLTALPALAGENWPCWRGPTGMGLSDETDLPLTWGGKKQENVRWKAPLFPSDKMRRDQNQSSPIVWGERVIVTVSYWPVGVSEKEYPEHHVMCFDAGDGHRLWDVTVAPGPWKLTDLRGGYTAPTPACDGQRVYVAFGSAVVAALNLDGKQAWRREVVPYDFDVAWGASPIIYEDTVIFTCDEALQKKASFLMALDAKTGAVRWKQERPDVDWAHSTPLLARIGDRTQLLVATANGPQGIDPATGELIWWFRSNVRYGDTITPVYRDGMVYVDSGRGGGLGGTGIAVDATGKGDISKVKPKWKAATPTEGFASPIIVGEHHYRLASPGVLTCRKWADGEEVYKNWRLDGVDHAISPIATADGRIYYASAGKSHVIKAGEKQDLLGSSDLGDPGRASPAVAAGRLYLKGGRYLYCIGRKD
jgi:deoxyribose-phosphate aldolase